MALYRNKEFFTDSFHNFSETLPHGSSIILNKTEFLANPDMLLANYTVAVRIDSHETLTDLEAYLKRISLIILHIGKFVDGRIYSLAMLLRRRFAYKGEIRAEGDILFDQLTFLNRVGINSFNITHQPTINELQKGSVAGMSHFYQASVRDNEKSVMGSENRRII